MSEINLVEVAGGVQRPSAADSGSFYLVDGSTVTLRFRLSVESGEALEALRYARRSLLREDWTRGRDSEEPPLEDAVFSPVEIVWVVRPAQRVRCLEKLEELRRRANLFLSDLERGSRPAQASGANSPV